MKSWASARLIKGRHRAAIREAFKEGMMKTECDLNRRIKKVNKLLNEAMKPLFIYYAPRLFRQHSSI